MHEKTADGRDRHSFTKVNGDWVCDCGERRDRFGASLPTLPMVLP
jgi:hypothetical protein